MEQHAPQTVLVVVQGDAVCTDWMSHWGPCPDGGFCQLEQEEWESPRAFQDRLARTLGRAALDGRSDSTIVLVVGSAGDRASLAERWGTSTIVLQHLAAAGGGRLVLVQGYGGDERGERELAAIARELDEEWQESGVQVASRLADAPRAVRPSAAPLRSGVHATTPRELAQTA